MQKRTSTDINITVSYFQERSELQLSDFKSDYTLQSSDFQVRLRIPLNDSKSDLQSSDFKSTITDYGQATSKYDYGFS